MPPKKPFSKILPKHVQRQRQTILPLHRELLRKDAEFRKKVTEIKYGLASMRFTRKDADILYYRAMDDAIRRIRASRPPFSQKAA